MSFDPVTYSAVKELEKKIGSGGAEEPKYEYVWSSRTITVPKGAKLTIRAMGAGGGGGAIKSSTDVAHGGTRGTVALKTLHVVPGDVLNVVIPAGGTGGISDSSGNAVAATAGGTLLVNLNSSAILSIPGGGAAGATTANPTGADWYVKSTPPTSFGGGSAMLLEGYSATGKATDFGGAGVLGDSRGRDGGNLMPDVGLGLDLTGGGWLTPSMLVLRILDASQGFVGGSGSGRTGINGSFGAGGGGGSNSSGSLGSGFGGAGGFGGGGGGAHGATSSGTSYHSLGGAGGAGGGGGGAGGTPRSARGGIGGQGWVTLEWRYA